MRVIGLCRFSYPAIGGFKTTHTDTASREAYLYAPERLASRLRHFQALTLASLRAQTDPDFTLLVLVGTSLPAPFRARLDAMVADVPQVRIIARPPGKHRQVMQSLLLEELGQGPPESIQFRLDDDDAVGVQFVERLRTLAHSSAKMRRPYRFFGIDYNHGYSAMLGPTGIRAEAVTPHMWSCGMALICGAGQTRTIMNVGHQKLHQMIPTLILPKPEMFVRGVHANNDSLKDPDTRRLRPLDATRSAYFKAQFNIDEALVKQLFQP